MQEEELSLPESIRCMIYSFIPLIELINKISKLNKFERNLLKNNLLLNQKKILLIKFDYEREINDMMELIYCLNICNGIELEINKFNEKDSVIFQLICSQCPQKMLNISQCFWVSQIQDYDILNNTLKRVYKSTFQRLNLSLEGMFADQIIFNQFLEQFPELHDLYLNFVEVQLQLNQISLEKAHKITQLTLNY